MRVLNEVWGFFRSMSVVRPQKGEFSLVGLRFRSFEG